MTSGVRVSETSEATTSPTARPSGEPSPTSSTVPTSMPPDPVTGLCILPQRPTISRTSARTASPSPPCLSASWRNEAASRLSRCTRTRTSSSRIAGSVSSRWAACGSAPSGSSTRCMPTGSPVMRPTAPHSFLSRLDQTGDIAAMCLVNRKILSILSQEGRAAHNHRAGPSRRTHEHRDIHRRHRRGRDRPALPLPPRGARRARLDPVPGLEGRHRRGVEQRPVAARALREEHPAAP